MALLYAHRGPISGITHFHLLRESAEVRAARMAEQRPALPPDTERTNATERSPDGGQRAGRRQARSRTAEPADNL
jgi:hypothetical protein